MGYSRIKVISVKLDNKFDNNLKNWKIGHESEFDRTWSLDESELFHYFLTGNNLNG